MSPISYIRQVREELEKVSYPKRAEVIRLTIIVIAVSLGIAFLLAGFDYIFSRLIDLLLRLGGKK